MPREAIIHNSDDSFDDSDSNNQDDLNAFYHVSIEDAIWDTIEDSDKIESMLLELGENDDLDTLFRPLNNNETAESLLQKDKDPFCLGGGLAVVLQCLTSYIHKD